ncbi:MAG: AAA family ATPase [Myxococcaceae bacterium]
MSPPKFLRDLDTLIRARYPLLYLVTWEEQRLDQLMQQVAQSHGKDLYEWSVNKGLKPMEGTKGPRGDELKNPIDALLAIPRLPNPSLVLLKDFHRQLDDPRVARGLRELSFQLKTGFSTVLIVAPTLNLPVELEKDVSVIDVPLPSRDDLMHLLRDIAGVVTRNKRATVELNRDQAESLVAAAHGLTLAEAENAFAKAIAEDSRLDASDVRLVLEEKSQVVRKSGMLEYFATDFSLDDVGGLLHLKEWLSRRRNAFSDSARKFGLPEPKGLLLLGVQGCGKSLTAKAIATQWRLPLLRLDMGRIYSGLIGSSEENLRRAIRVTESLAPAVLWVDEIEKGIANSVGGGGDSGVSARVFGTLLTWLQEKTAPVFVVATANRIDALPPELLRKGRFDEIFFIDLPSADERQAIFEIQLRRRGRDPAGFPLEALAKASANFSGAEIEQAVVSALYDAFADGVELSAPLVLRALQETRPLAVTMAEDVNRLREWAQQRTRSAS